MDRYNFRNFQYVSPRYLIYVSVWPGQPTRRLSYFGTDNYIPLYSARRTHQFIRENVRINMRAMSLPVLGVKRIAC